MLESSSHRSTPPQGVVEPKEATPAQAPSEAPALPAPAPAPAPAPRKFDSAFPADMTAPRPSPVPATPRDVVLHPLPPQGIAQGALRLALAPCGSVESFHVLSAAPGYSLGAIRVRFRSADGARIARETHAQRGIRVDGHVLRVSPHPTATHPAARRAPAACRAAPRAGSASSSPGHPYGPSARPGGVASPDYAGQGYSGAPGGLPRVRSAVYVGGADYFGGGGLATRGARAGRFAPY